MKKVLGLSLIMAFLFSGYVFANGNYEGSSEYKQERATDRALDEMNAQIGLPVINNYFEKKVFKWILEARDNADLITYAYVFSEYHGKFVFLGQCIGYGLPYSIQYTNPMQRSSYNLPQADPNGLYMPDGLSATWLLMIDPETNKPKPVYMEPTITVTPFPLNKRICIGGINS